LPWEATNRTLHGHTCRKFSFEKRGRRGYRAERQAEKGSGCWGSGGKVEISMPTVEVNSKRNQGRDCLAQGKRHPEKLSGDHYPRVRPARKREREVARATESKSNLETRGMHQGGIIKGEHPQRQKQVRPKKKVRTYTRALAHRGENQLILLLPDVRENRNKKKGPTF